MLRTRIMRAVMGVALSAVCVGMSGGEALVHGQVHSPPQGPMMNQMSAQARRYIIAGIIDSQDNALKEIKACNTQRYEQTMKLWAMHLQEAQLHLAMLQVFAGQKTLSNQWEHTLGEGVKRFRNAELQWYEKCKGIASSKTVPRGMLDPTLKAYLHQKSPIDSKASTAEPLLDEKGLNNLLADMDRKMEARILQEPLPTFAGTSSPYPSLQNPIFIPGKLPQDYVVPLSHHVAGIPFRSTTILESGEEQPVSGQPDLNITILVRMLPVVKEMLDNPTFKDLEFKIPEEDYKAIQQALDSQDFGRGNLPMDKDFSDPRHGRTNVATEAKREPVMGDPSKQFATDPTPSLNNTATQEHREAIVKLGNGLQYCKLPLRAYDGHWVGKNGKTYHVMESRGKLYVYEDYGKGVIYWEGQNKLEDDRTIEVSFKPQPDHVWGKDLPQKVKQQLFQQDYTYPLGAIFFACDKAGNPAIHVALEYDYFYWNGSQQLTKIHRGYKKESLTLELQQLSNHAKQWAAPNKPALQEVLPTKPVIDRDHDHDGGFSTREPYSR